MFEFNLGGWPVWRLASWPFYEIKINLAFEIITASGTNSYAPPLKHFRAPSAKKIDTHQPTSTLLLLPDSLLGILYLAHVYLSSPRRYCLAPNSGFTTHGHHSNRHRVASLPSSWRRLKLSLGIPFVSVSPCSQLAGCFHNSLRSPYRRFLIQSFYGRISQLTRMIHQRIPVELLKLG